MPVYQQSGRWASEGIGAREGAAEGAAREETVEVIAVAPQISTPLLHDAHLDLLREVHQPSPPTHKYTPAHPTTPLTPTQPHP